MDRTRNASMALFCRDVLGLRYRFAVMEERSRTFFVHLPDPRNPNEPGLPEWALDPNLWPV